MFKILNFFCENCVDVSLGAGFSKHLAVGAAEPVNVDALARSSARDTLLVSKVVVTLLPSLVDPGWLYRKPDPNFSIPNTVSKRSRIRIKEFNSFYKKMTSFLSSRNMFIPDPGSGFFPSRIRIRNTVATFSRLCLFNVHH